MKVTDIMGDKQPPVVINTPTVTQTVPPANTNKYKITLAVLASVTIVAVTAGFVGVFYFHTDTLAKVTRHQHIDFKTLNGSASEEVEIDDEENIAKYSIVTDEGDVIHLIEDFDRKLGIMEVKDADTASCSVYVMETDSSTKDIEEISVEVTADDMDVHVYEQQDDSIANTDFLPKEAQEMCAGLKVYWAMEVHAENYTEEVDVVDEPNAPEHAGHRVRRWGWARRAVKKAKRVVTRVVSRVVSRVRSYLTECRRKYLGRGRWVRTLVKLARVCVTSCGNICSVTCTVTTVGMLGSC